jgi:hypothetical protein
MKWLSHCLAATLICTGAAAHAQDYPNKPINIVVPFTPGGVTDVMTRQVAAKLQADLGQPVVVVNKPGAGTMIASAYVAKAPADGYTLLMAASSLGIAPSLYKNTANYDPVKDFQPVSLIASVPHAQEGRQIGDLRLFRQRHVQPSGGRAVRRADRPEDDPHPLQGQRSSVDLPGWRRSRHAVRGHRGRPAFPR